MSVMAALCVNVVTVNMLLSVFFLSGVWAQCDKVSHLLITAPKKMEALSGSCLKIPCNYREKPGKGFDSRKEIFGVWIKNNPDPLVMKNNAVFNSSGSVNIYPMNIIGDLRQKNCTTLFYNLKRSHSDTYYFRIENVPFMATADCDPFQITVKDSPWRPRINISGDLKEKESVTITCSAFTPCPHSPPQLTWNLQQDPHNKIEENTDGTFTTKIQETITLSDTHDGYNISCSVRYPVNEGKDVKTAETQETLSVSYAPKDTSASISPSGLVSAGIWVNLTCSSRAKPPVRRFTWFKNSKYGPMIVSEGHIYSFNVTDGGVYYCVASNELGNQTSPWIHLNVEESSQTSVTESHLTVEESSQTSVTESHLTVEESYQTSVTEIHLDVEEFGVDVHVTVKILGITILYSTIIIFECWFRSRCSNKPHKDTEEEEDSYFNRVVEIQAS